MTTKQEADHMIGYDCSDEYDTLLINGMFRNREQNSIPISGSNQDGASWNQDEIELHNKNFAECIELDQMQTLSEAFPVGY